MISSKNHSVSDNRIARRLSHWFALACSQNVHLSGYPSMSGIRAQVTVVTFEEPMTSLWLSCRAERLLGQLRDTPSSAATRIDRYRRVSGRNAFQWSRATTARGAAHAVDNADASNARGIEARLGRLARWRALAAPIPALSRSSVIMRRASITAARQRTALARRV
jgi:hypothetical protein